MLEAWNYSWPERFFNKTLLSSILKFPEFSKSKRVSSFCKCRSSEDSRCKMSKRYVLFKKTKCCGQRIGGIAIIPYSIVGEEMLHLHFVWSTWVKCSMNAEQTTWTTLHSYNTCIFGVVFPETTTDQEKWERKHGSLIGLDCQVCF